MPKRPAMKPKRRSARRATSPRHVGRAAKGAAKIVRRNPRSARRGARLLGRSARGGTKLWAKGKAASATGRTGARTGVKVLKAARRRRPARSRLVVTGGLAALGAYFLDPQNGKRRRQFATDKAGKVVRRGRATTESKARHAGGVAAGVTQKAAPGDGREASEARLNDPALARKVESEIFSDSKAPKGAVSINVENGVVYLRGEVDKAKQREKLAAKAGKVDGVREVQNLLHGPGEPAPAKSDGGPGSGAA